MSCEDDLGSCGQLLCVIHLHAMGNNHVNLADSFRRMVQTGKCD